MTEMYLSPNPPAPLKLRGTGSSLLRKEWGYVFVVQLYIPLLAKQGGGLRGWVRVTSFIAILHITFIHGFQLCRYYFTACGKRKIYIQNP
jgi:hypothetical protein